jgi:hypothetical protein
MRNELCYINVDGRFAQQGLDGTTGGDAVTGGLVTRFDLHREVTVNRNLYNLFGVCFSADIPLQLPSAPSDQVPRFALSASECAWPSGGAGRIIGDVSDDWMSFRLYGNGYVEMEWRDWMSFWIDPDGRTVLYRLKEATYPSAFEAFVGNFAASACLLLQGEEPLHATVVRYKGAGLGMLGPSGAGKSTLSAHLLTLGAELITDDMLRITEQDEMLFAEPGLARLKLFAEAAALHCPLIVDQGRWNPLSEKYLFDFSVPTEPRERVPLNALLYLSPPDENASDGVELRRLEGLELFEILTSSTMNSRLQTKDRLARQFAFATSLAGRLPVYALTYPRVHDIFPAVVAAIEESVLRA